MSQIDGSTSTDSRESAYLFKPIKTEKIDDDEIAKRVGNSISCNLKAFDSVSRNCLVKDIRTIDSTNVDFVGTSSYKMSDGKNLSNLNRSKNLPSLKTGSEGQKNKQTTLEGFCSDTASGNRDKNNSSLRIKKEQVESFSISDTLSAFTAFGLSREIRRSEDQTTEDISLDTANAVANQAVLTSDTESSAQGGYLTNKVGKLSILNATPAENNQGGDCTLKKIPAKNKIIPSSTPRTPDMLSSSSFQFNRKSHTPSPSIACTSSSLCKEHVECSDQSDDEPLENWVKKTRVKKGKKSPAQTIPNQGDTK